MRVNAEVPSAKFLERTWRRNSGNFCSVSALAILYTSQKGVKNSQEGSQPSLRHCVAGNPYAVYSWGCQVRCIGLCRAECE